MQPFNVPQYRFTPVVPYEAVALSPFDRAPQLRLSKDGLTVAGHKGYRLIRGTHGISQGAWYCEATVMEDLQDPDLEERFLNEKGHCRLGWARSSAHIQLPVGADRFGYCLCLKDGHVVHERKPKKYASACAETGTVIGIYIYLPERDVPAEALPTEPRDKFWWKNSGKEYYLDEDRDTGSETHAASVMRFFVNGKDQGVAFKDLQAGIYYPAASVYMGGQVSYNFGPDFKHGLPEKPDGVQVRALSELVVMQREHLHKPDAFLHTPNAWPTSASDSTTPVKQTAVQ